MAYFLHYYEALSAYTNDRSNNYVEPWVSLTEENSLFEVNYNKINPKYIPLTFEITSDGFVNWKASRTANPKTIEYKKNDDDWTSITSTSGGTQISVVSGDIVQFRGNNDSYATSTINYNTFSGTTSNFKVKGNIMSLIDPTNYATMTNFPDNSSYNFYHLLQDCMGLTDVSELILPATTLAESCYYGMFQGCTSLVNAPELPATTLATGCYRDIFTNCTSLVNTPELPATTLAESCYYGMFQGCTSLTTAPELPATTLAIYCYNTMFYDCASLVNAPVLPATTLAERCYAFMFGGCTSLTTAPELPATTLTNNCYRSMFNRCTSLNYIKCLATDISATECTSYWVRSVQTTSGTFVTPSSTQWTTGESGVPTGWTRVDA